MNKTVQLNNGIEMPLLGLGIYAPGEKNEVRQAVTQAIECGYRLLDTASIYENEEEVGKGIQDSLIPREELFITSKVWNTDQGYENTLRAYEQSLERLQTNYLDLYLIHWPVRGLREDSWMALEKLYSEGRVRAIGVSNYYKPHLEELFSYASVVPAVNQFEFSPFQYIPDLLRYCEKKGIKPEGYAPLVRGKQHENPVLTDISRKTGKSTFQVLIRWAMQHNVVTIPKSVSKKHLEANWDVWDFELDEEDMHRLNSLHADIRVADNPMDYL